MIDDAGPDDAGAPDSGVCSAGDGGCIPCPVTSTDFLNRCGATSCAPFDNATRVPGLYPDGGLPPIP